MIVIGLTGSIGMGKSATAQMFRDAGVPVHDSDAAVHDVYRGAAVPIIVQHFPNAVVNGVVDRQVLAKEVLADPLKLKLLETLIHPLVKESRDQFSRYWLEKQSRLVVVDIPLLFEIKAQGSVNLIVVCSAPAELQRQRVLARPGMSVEKFEAILAKQVPDQEKRAQAHVVIDTGHGLQKK